MGLEQFHVQEVHGYLVRGGHPVYPDHPGGPVHGGGLGPLLQLPHISTEIFAAHQSCSVYFRDIFDHLNCIWEISSCQ